MFALAYCLLVVMRSSKAFIQRCMLIWTNGGRKLKLQASHIAKAAVLLVSCARKEASSFVAIAFSFQTLVDLLFPCCCVVAVVLHGVSCCHRCCCCCLRQASCCRVLTMGLQQQQHTILIGMPAPRTQVTVLSSTYISCCI